ncbi:YcxB family protein [Microbulbifer agarilyticus]|uniref:YcxB family protein n=1 Tax=Microbulbifer agarilyticus TaxID=260552 RepID=UPI001CD3AB26|nr:YcxB family protein [Microbulbifer agarilyticus]MCA0894832.1 YcxB family protein [Microbulbifer agarilyticus]
MQPFKTQFTLSRDYLAECYDQSSLYGKSIKPNYLFPVLMLAAGTGTLLYTEQPKVLGYILVAFALLELLHIRFRRAWWLARQMLGKSANSKVTLTIDDERITTQSDHAHTTLLWSDIEQVVDTELGLILITKSSGQHYLSKSLFPDGLVEKIKDRAASARA